MKNTVFLSKMKLVEVLRGSICCYSFRSDFDHTVLTFGFHKRLFRWILTSTIFRFPPRVLRLRNADRERVRGCVCVSYTVDHCPLPPSDWQCCCESFIFHPLTVPPIEQNLWVPVLAAWNKMRIGSTVSSSGKDLLLLKEKCKISLHLLFISAAAAQY